VSHINLAWTIEQHRLCLGREQQLLYRSPLNETLGSTLLGLLLLLLLLE